MRVNRLRDVLDDVARDAPEVRVPPGLYRSVRRRHRLRRWTATVLAVAVLVLGAVVVAPGPVARRSGPAAPAAQPGLPTRLVTPPWWTDTVKRAPAGPASVVFSAGEDTIQGDHEDGWPTAYESLWRYGGQTVSPSVVVGLTRDTYRVVRGSYTVGTELSPDGRYLIVANRVVDLSSGRETTLPDIGGGKGYPPRGTWSADGRRILYQHQDTVAVVAWPSRVVEWTIHATRAAEFANGIGFALSPDGSMFAMQEIDELRVYRGDGARLWSYSRLPDRLAGRETELAGPAAWRPDGTLTLIRYDRNRNDTSLPGPPPAAAELAFVDAQSGTPRPALGHPRLAETLGLRVSAWRGDTAYGVVAHPTGKTDPSGRDIERLELIELVPGSDARTLLVAPGGIVAMSVATDYVDVFRPTGRPETGRNTPEVIGRRLKPLVLLAPCWLPLLAIVVGLIWRRRRRHRGVRVGGAPDSAARTNT